MTSQISSAQIVIAVDRRCKSSFASLAFWIDLVSLFDCDWLNRIVAMFPISSLFFLANTKVYKCVVGITEQGFSTCGNHGCEVSVGRIRWLCQSACVMQPLRALAVCRQPTYESL